MDKLKKYATLMLTCLKEYETTGQKMPCILNYADCAREMGYLHFSIRVYEWLLDEYPDNMEVKKSHKKAKDMLELDSAGAFMQKSGFPEPDLLIRENFHGITLSLCMIAKNEENNIKRAIESVRLIADEMIVVDTGSTDNTPKIAKAYGAKVFDYKWNDNFSEARNFSLEQAGMEWILVLDADETIAYEDLFYIKETIKEMEIAKKSGKLEGKRADGFALAIREYTYFNMLGGFDTKDDFYAESKPYKSWIEQRLVRLFRNMPHIRYMYPVYEIIEESICTNGGTFYHVGIPIHHFGRTVSMEKQRSKRRYYIKILEEHLKISEECDNYKAVYCTNLGNAYTFMGELENAMKYFKKALEYDDSISVTYVCIGKNAMMRKNIIEAIKYFEKAIEMEKNNPEPFRLLVQCYNSCYKFSEAKRVMEEAHREGHEI
ncbi:MAG: hypothetical protein CVT88_00335 [Candidatus Altiarchaeales archaeon HGW-Altiarchaeales-1]|nr:MAG: hypothetical protein CVT88_00335 [Candidatus Altiarchaeales archaeon HGW-Altiarchaeales-1]